MRSDMVLNRKQLHTLTMVHDFCKLKEQERRQVNDIADAVCFAQASCALETVVTMVRRTQGNHLLAVVDNNSSENHEEEEKR